MTFEIRSDDVDVEAIMAAIRKRIEEKRRGLYTEEEVQEIADHRLDAVLDAHEFNTDFVADFRSDPARWNFLFGPESIYRSSRGGVGQALEVIRRVLRPIQKLFWNPNPMISALSRQSDLNAYYVHLLHNLAVEVTKLNLEVQDLRNRNLQLQGRLELQIRREKTLEDMVVFREDPEAFVLGRERQRRRVRSRARLKLAFVVQRYGLDIAGGAEYHCRLVAEHMARHAHVEVLTTCAADYITWANHYPEGVETLNGIPVRRFRVKRPRDPERFAEKSARVLGVARDRRTVGAPSALGASPKEELSWLEEEGPLAPRLVRDLERRRAEFDFFIFFSYRYYTTYHGLRVVGDKALLVPTAEDDGVYRLSIFPPVFRMPRGIVYNSFEEKAMIEAVASNQGVASDVVGVGSELPSGFDALGFRRRHHLDGRFVLYVGRIDENKGCRELFAHFRQYRKETGSALRLVLVGKPVLPVPTDPGIVSLGFLPDAEKWNALAAADLLVMPSRYESLSMVTLEAWWAERPVLANARCDVLRGQCQRSNAGLYYSSYEEFREALALLEGNEDLRGALGANGRRYFADHYAWDVVERKYLSLLARLGSKSAA